MLCQYTIDIIQTVIQFLGLTSIVLLACQIRSSAKWSRRYNSQNKIDQNFLTSNYTKLEDAGINTRAKELEKEDLTKIIDNEGLKCICQDILNYLEFFSISFNLKMIDKDFAYQAYSEDIILAYEFFKPLIDSEDVDKLFYSELRKCYNVLKRIDNFKIIINRIRIFYKT